MDLWIYIIPWFGLLVSARDPGECFKHDNYNFCHSKSYNCLYFINFSADMDGSQFGVCDN